MKTEGLTIVESVQTYLCIIMAINFYNADANPRLTSKRVLKAWITRCVHDERKSPGPINIIFCSDEYLLDINIKFLDHNFYTDIITFDNSIENLIAGELYISLDRVSEYALKNSIPTKKELYRVIIHGVMHLCGYKDKTKTDQIEMRKVEDKCLKKLQKSSPELFHVEPKNKR
jgi:probable rRNA maturation factor